MRLTDDTITLRALEPTDANVMYLWENDSELWRYGSQVAPYSQKQIWEYINSYNADIFVARQLRLMIVDNATATPVGAIDLTDFDPINRRAQVGIFIDRQWQRRGYASRALQLTMGYCRERLGMHQLWAVVPTDNAPCRALFESSGFAISGHLKSWIRVGRSYIDAYFYHRFLV